MWGDIIRALLIRWAIITVAIAIAAGILPSVDVEGGFFGVLGVALVFGLVNALIGPVLRLLSLPLTLLTFGLFSLVVNAVLLIITAAIADNLDVGGFFSSVLAALLISLLTAILGKFVPEAG
jgi:putative membrane protein